MVVDAIVCISEVKDGGQNMVPAWVAYRTNTLQYDLMCRESMVDKGSLG